MTRLSLITQIISRQQPHYARVQYTRRPKLSAVLARQKNPAQNGVWAKSQRQTCHSPAAPCNSPFASLTFSGAHTHAHHPHILISLRAHRYTRRPLGKVASLHAPKCRRSSTAHNGAHFPLVYTFCAGRDLFLYSIGE